MDNYCDKIKLACLLFLLSFPAVLSAEVYKWVEPNGGIMCFPRYKLALSSKVLCQKLLDDQRILVIPGEYFDLDGHIRLSYSCSKGALKRGLGALAKGLRRLS